MFKSIAAIIGFDWIKNTTVKNIVRFVFNVGLVVVSGLPQAAPILTVFGIVPDPILAAQVAAAAGLIEAARSAIKHDGK